MKNPTKLSRKIVSLSVAPVAVLLAGAMVWQASSAAFTSNTSNPGNSWATGSVALSDDDKGAAAFTVENIVPGQTGTKTLVVSSAATVAGEVRTYITNLVPSAAGLEDHLTLTIEPGTGGSFNDSTGFVPDNAANPAWPLSTIATASFDYATGAHPWVTKGGEESKSYRVTWTFDTTGLSQAEVDELQGASVSADLVWELRNTETS